MLTKNWSRLNLFSFCGLNNSGYIATIKNMLGDNCYIKGTGIATSQFLSSSTNMTGAINAVLYVKELASTSNSAPTPGTGVVFGDGTGTPSKDDFELFGNLITSYNASNNIVKQYSEDYSSATITITHTVANTSTSSITIGEIGLVSLFPCSPSPTTTGSRYSSILLEHTALENPVTIEPNGVAQIVHTITVGGTT